MNVIYLDRQLIIEAYEGGVEVNSAIRACAEKGFIFPYSPAHIEEIAGAVCSGKRDDLASQINHLQALSNGWAIMPHHRGHAELRQEDIDECLSRVKDNGGRDKTELAINAERDRIVAHKKRYNDNNEYWSKTRKRIEKMPPEAVLRDGEVIFFLEHLAINFGFRINASTFIARERTMEVLLNVLNLFGFKKEHSEKRMENRLHDVSHAIYASYSDLFVTNDDKLRDLAKALFPFLRLNVRIMDRADFLVFSNSG